MRLIIWECPVCGFHHRIHTPPTNLMHCDDCKSDISPFVTYDSQPLSTEEVAAIMATAVGVSRETIERIRSGSRNGSR